MLVVMSPQCWYHGGSHVTRVVVMTPQWLSNHHSVGTMLIVMSPQCSYHDGSHVTIVKVP